LSADGTKALQMRYNLVLRHPRATLGHFEGVAEMAALAAKMVNSQVEKNFAAFQKELPRLLGTHAGKFAVLHNEKIENFFDSFADAAKFGLEKFGSDNFSVQEVTSKDINLGFHSYALHHHPA